MSKVKIVKSKRGYHLVINNLYISHGFNSDGVPIRAIITEQGIPYGATTWGSVDAIKDFWHTYKKQIILAIYHPCKSIKGQQKFIEL